VDGVYVNGSGPYRFLVDTGTNVNLMEAELARSIHLAPAFRVQLASSTGSLLVPGAKGIEVTLDSAKAGGQEFLFSRLEEIRRRWPDIQGVLGQEFLSRFDYMLDLHKKRLEFGKQERAGTRSQSHSINGRPTLATSLGDLVLDSGVATLVLFGVEPDPAPIQKYGPALKTFLRTLTGSREIGQVSGVKLVIAGRNIWRGDAVAIPNSNEKDADGLLPLSVFKSIYFCNSEGYVVFE